MISTQFFSLKKEVCLCLGGGGALGFAHIGVLRALEEHEIFPTQISGVSIGAIIGGFYAAGYSSEEMLEIIKEEKLYKLTSLFSFKLNILKEGLTKSDILRDLIRRKIPHNSFEGLKRKLFVCVTEMNTGTYKILDSGNTLDKWIAASACLPCVFEPIKDEQNWYLDGGVLNNFPAQCFKKKKKNTIGVDVIPFVENNTAVKSTLEIAHAVVRVAEQNNSKAGYAFCQYLIQPLELAKYDVFSFSSYKEIEQIGYDETKKMIVETPRILRLRNPKKKVEKR